MDGKKDFAEIWHSSADYDMLVLSQWSYAALAFNWGGIQPPCAHLLLKVKKVQTRPKYRQSRRKQVKTYITNNSIAIVYFRNGHNIDWGERHVYMSTRHVNREWQSIPFWKPRGAKPVVLPGGRRHKACRRSCPEPSPQLRLTVGTARIG